MKVEWENGTTEGRKAELELIAIDRGRGPDDRDPESDHNQSYFSSVSDCLTGRSFARGPGHQERFSGTWKRCNGLRRYLSL